MKSKHYYKVGGSLKANHPTYVFRQGDRELLERLTARDYCCVFNSRQMGKSSLRIQTMKTLRKQEINCASIDLTILGNHVSQEQWYQGFCYQILAGFDLEDKVNFTSWWEQQIKKTNPQKLLGLLELILGIKKTNNLVIFIDEIDSLIKLDFKDDIFALIRSCYNLRAEKSDYNRLTFCLLGVATPSYLIEDKQRTPFNISYFVGLTGFSLEEAKSALLPGLEIHLDDAETILKQIISWTGGQPFLTQKLCRIISKNVSNSQVNVNSLVKQHILDNWEYQDQPEHLKTIGDRLLDNETKAIQLLGLYKQILLSKMTVDNSPEQMELRLSGIVGIKGQYLQVYNRIYEEVFNLDWVDYHLARLRPYAAEMNKWINSNYDPNFLLKSDSLEQVMEWSDSHKLSSIDYHFITTSQQFLVQQETLEKEAKIKANFVLKEANKKANNSMRRGGIIGILLIMISLIIVHYQVKKAKVWEATAEIIEQSYNAEQEFSSRPLQSLRSGMKIAKQLENSLNYQSSLDEYPTFSPVGTLLTILNQIQAFNQVETTLTELSHIQFSSQGNFVAVLGKNKLNLLDKSGKIIHRSTLMIEGNVIGLSWIENEQKLLMVTDKGKVHIWDNNSQKIVLSFSYNKNLSEVYISPNGEMTVTMTPEGLLEVWDKNNRLIKRFASVIEGVSSLSISPNNQTIAVATEDGKIMLWDINNNVQKILKSDEDLITKIRFSPDNKMIATAIDDYTIKLWTIEGNLLQVLEDHKDRINDIRFNSQGEFIASSSEDQMIKIWGRDGTLIHSLSGHSNSVNSIDFSPDGNVLVSGDDSQIIKFWRLNPGILNKLVLEHPIINIDLNANTDEIIISDFQGTITRSSLTEDTSKAIKLNRPFIPPELSPNKDKIAIVLQDGIIKLFDSNGQLIKEIDSNNLQLWSLAFHPKQDMIAVGTDGGEIKLYDFEGTLIKTLKTKDGLVTKIAFHPDGDLMVSGNENGMIYLWDAQGTLIKRLNHHQKYIKDLTFSPDGKNFVSASDDQTLKLWTGNGDLLNTFTGHSNTINQIIFSPKGSIIASGDKDGNIKLWRKEGTPLATIKASKTSITSLRFTDDGLSLISGDAEGVVTVWPLEIQALLGKGCLWLEDYLLIHPQQQKELQFCSSVTSE